MGCVPDFISRGLQCVCFHACLLQTAFSNQFGDFRLSRFHFGFAVFNHRFGLVLNGFEFFGDLVNEVTEAIADALGEVFSFFRYLPSRGRSFVWCK